VYLFIDDGAVQIKSARHMWGKTTWEAERMIRDELWDQKAIFGDALPCVSTHMRWCNTPSPP